MESDHQSESDSEMENAHPHPTRIQQLLTPLRESITNKPPYISGTLPLPASCFSLFYRTTEDYRRIDLANATRDELEQLAQACEPTSSEMNKKAMKDGPAKMDLESFAPLLVPGQTNLVKVIRDYHFEGDKSSQRLWIDLRELNVYSTHFHCSLHTFEAQQSLKSLTHIGKGSFCEPRVEAPPDKSMFGSLVIIFPTPHEGGVMSLRSRTSHKWSFDPSPETSDITHRPSIGYVVLLKDVEHEAAPVTSGHRVTLTYDLYAENDDGPVSTKVQRASESIPPLANERAFHDAFAALLENREFMADDGGTLAFGLANAYSIGKTFKHVYGALKGSDAVVYRTLRALGFEPVLRMYYHEWEPDWAGELLHGQAVVFDEIVNFSAWRWEEDFSIPDVVKWMGGQIMCPEDLQTDEDFNYSEEVVVWVTPGTTSNRKESTFASPRERFADTNVAYGDLSLFVRIGKAGERLSYPRITRSNNEATSSENEDMKLDEEAISVDSESQGSED
jgi:hypothetical protein